MRKNKIIKKFLIKKNQEQDIQRFLDMLISFNTHTNLVGKSTLKDPWKNHILDSLQILPHITNKNLSLIDMGTGAGFPGAVLSIMGCNNVTLVDSRRKKINFLSLAKTEMFLKYSTILGRVEEIKNLKYDIITSRALANLETLFTYSQNFLKKKTVIIFLKGKTVNDEIKKAEIGWNFDYKKIQSLSDPRGSVLLIRNLRKIHD